MLTDVGLSNTVTYLRVRNPPYDIGPLPKPTLTRLLRAISTRPMFEVLVIRSLLFSSLFLGYRTTPSRFEIVDAPHRAYLICSQVDMFSMEMEIVEVTTSNELIPCTEVYIDSLTAKTFLKLSH
ncbi:hypothetical protein BHE74_00045564 [Ensete ventricosum]|nr:hypothetical protein BHE74_00045564 [Ensete ventricosum]